MAYGVRLHISGPRALFTRPEMKVERVSYDVITPSAVKGVLSAIHWKPAIAWHVDCIRVLNPIRFDTIRRNEVGSKIAPGSVSKAMKAGSTRGLYTLVEEDRQQRASVVLRDVAYVIDAHFSLTDAAGPDDNEGKHLDIFNRRLARGQCFQQPCLGTREFAADFEPAPDPLPDPHPDLDGQRDLGWMLYDIDYDRGAQPRFFRARMVDGVIAVPPPDSDEVRS
ncbi:type I-C CRISPR-associated protein Cas5 [Tistrella bauzanensis]|uniref:pre-crRNA processing endonuclease n=1 Tax=Tistrella bauzanensis TaxID=657419 RepID=A0ABQ1IE69_9PROT|nr:type I-C CRISPR-associated protein Cas5c [Tistrella bauzanensis]GGB32982.1 type I-C CRISPR-associated protein Cas5 [Tistrella bauzanensis]